MGRSTTRLLLALTCNFANLTGILSDGSLLLPRPLEASGTWHLNRGFCLGYDVPDGWLLKCNNMPLSDTPRAMGPTHIIRLYRLPHLRELGPFHEPAV
jgi:hypothetical protein